MANTTEDEVGLEEHDTTEEMDTDFKKEVTNNNSNNIPELIEIGDSLDGIAPNPILVDIAKTNKVSTPWSELQNILKDIIKKQCDAMQDKLQDEGVRNTVDSVKTNIIHVIEEHTNCPFTIQRLCELTNDPKKNYKMYIKYLRAVEKVLMVTSYWEDFVEIYNEVPAEDKAGDSLLPSFVSGMELEPHNFDLNTSSDQADTAIQQEDEDTSTGHNESGLPEKEEEIKENTEENEKQVNSENVEKDKSIDNESGNDESKMELDQKEE